MGEDTLEGHTLTRPMWYLNSEQDAAQDRAIPNFRDFIRGQIRMSAAALEIGPSYNPILPKKDGYNATVLDHADQAALVEKYSNSPATDVSSIESVDLVWRDGPLSSVLNDRQFTAIVASHVVEHAPDFIQFLSDLSAAMEPDGRLYLLIPDKRYFFDYFHAVTDPAKVLSDHLQRRTRHSFTSFYRWGTNVSHRGRGDWSQHPIDEVTFMYRDPHQTYRDALASTGADHYVDSHENYFTPISFVNLIEELHYLAHIELAVQVLTRTRTCEFLAVLSKRKPKRTVEGFLHLKRKLLALRMAEDLEAIAFAEWRYHPPANA